MTMQDVAKDKMNAALQRLDQAVARKIAADGDTSAHSTIDSLKSANAKLEEENKRLRELNENSVKKLDLAIKRMNDVLTTS